MKRGLLIINQSQFGYHTDTYYYCVHLKDKYAIKYICWDFGHARIKLAGVDVFYVQRGGSFLHRTLRFIKEVQSVVSECGVGTIIFVKYFKIAGAILRFLNWKWVMVLDIRTCSVDNVKFKRIISDFMMSIESKIYRNVTVASESLREKLSLKRTAFILPVGGNVISGCEKTFDDIRLLYVGTLENRNVADTLKGLSQFYSEYKESVKIVYTIVGSGASYEVDKIKQGIKEESLEGVVRYLGYVSHDKLTPIFDEANVGVSYIPVTDYYDVQPPTKTFEYLLSGFPVIATSTKENKKLINDDNGVIIGEGADEFYHGLVKLYGQLSMYDSRKISDGSQKYKWEHITNSLDNHLSSL